MTAHLDVEALVGLREMAYDALNEHGAQGYGRDSTAQKEFTRVVTALLAHIAGEDARVAASVAGVSAWQPIETAPRDGTAILATQENMATLGGGAPYAVLQWREDLQLVGWTGSTCMGLVMRFPTHWTPIAAIRETPSAE